MKKFLSVLVLVGIVLSTVSFNDLSGPTRPGTAPANVETDSLEGPTRPGT